MRLVVVKSSCDDKNLIDGCLQNDRKCQQELYDKFAPKMLAVCMRYAVTKHEAEDIMIEGFMQVFTHIGEFKQTCSLESWIRKIMVNKAISNFRVNHKRYHYDVIDTDLEVADDIADIETTLTGRKIIEIVQQMPEMIRMVFNLRIFEEYSFKEIGQELNMAESNARVYFMRARKWITDKFKDIDQNNIL
jgi:RNA polymerase sigma-70 factor (ECF subfamily)